MDEEMSDLMIASIRGSAALEGIVFTDEKWAEMVAAAKELNDE